MTVIRSVCRAPQARVKRVARSWLARVPAAIDDQLVSGHVIRRPRSEEDYAADDVLRLAEAASGNTRLHHRVGVGRALAPRPEVARQDGVDLDTVAGPLVRQRLRDANDRVLGS